MIINLEKETRIDLGLDYEGIALSVAEEVLRTEEIEDDCEADVLLVNDKSIREINLEQRDTDKATDVLSFPMIEYEIPGVLPEWAEECENPETGCILLGDIVISLERVRAQAKEYGHSEKREFAFLIAHSMLHLLGYDHVESEKDAKIMEAKQEQVLQTLGITREMAETGGAAAKRAGFKDKKRIVVKIGSSSLAHKETGELDLVKTEKLVRELTDLRNRGKDVVLVSSGAVMVGRNTLGKKDEGELNFKQACASVGQAKLMMIYQKLFAEYNQICSQVLLTQDNITDEASRINASSTMEELFRLGVIPVVNENDTVSTQELDKLSVLGDNDTLSAIVASLIGADLLILLSDIDGLYTDDPNKNKDAEFVEYVEHVDKNLLKMGKGPSSSVGTGGMATKLNAAAISAFGGVDMVIASGEDFSNIHRIIDGRNLGTVFNAEEKDESFLIRYLTGGGIQ